MRTGTGCGAVFWVVVAVPFVLAARVTSGVVSKVMWVVAAVLGLLAALNLVAYFVGYKRGGSNRDEHSEDEPQP